jgi:hypothetical protein
LKLVDAWVIKLLKVETNVQLKNVDNFGKNYFLPEVKYFAGSTPIHASRLKYFHKQAPLEPNETCSISVRVNHGHPLLSYRSTK